MLGKLNVKASPVMLCNYFFVAISETQLLENLRDLFLVLPVADFSFAVPILFVKSHL